MEVNSLHGNITKLAGSAQLPSVLTLVFLCVVEQHARSRVQGAAEYNFMLLLPLLQLSCGLPQSLRLLLLLLLLLWQTSLAP
jgi:hypothetical protein